MEGKKKEKLVQGGVTGNGQRIETHERKFCDNQILIGKGNMFLKVSRKYKEKEKLSVMRLQVKRG